jgi:putative nucleotidyltransferase with HDIG domain
MGWWAMDYNEAKALMQQHLQKDYLRKHSIAVSAIMRGIAKFLGEDEEKFSITGLLHDIDFEQTENQMDKHGVIAAEILNNKVDDEIIHAIKSHNFRNTGVEPRTTLDYALIASDAVSGLIIACALVHPNKKLDEVCVESISKKFKQKDFARRCDRELIRYCEKIGIELEKFFEIALNSLKEVTNELGL